jgi:hypothetical protein
MGSVLDGCESSRLAASGEFRGLRGHDLLRIDLSVRDWARRDKAVAAGASAGKRRRHRLAADEARGPGRSNNRPGAVRKGCAGGSGPLRGR